MATAAERNKLSDKHCTGLVYHGGKYADQPTLMPQNGFSHHENIFKALLNLLLVSHFQQFQQNKDTFQRGLVELVNRWNKYLSAVTGQFGTNLLLTTHDTNFINQRNLNVY